MEEMATVGCTSSRAEYVDNLPTAATHAMCPARTVDNELARG